MKEIEAGLNKWIALRRLWTRRRDIVKMSIFPKLTYR